MQRLRPIFIQVILIVVAALLSAPVRDRLFPVAREKRDAAGPDGADDWFAAQRMAPDGTLHLEARRRAIEDARELRARVRNGPEREFADLTWEPLGPINIGGRVTDIASSASSPNLVYVAAASGGVWKSTDTGASWTPIFDGPGTLAVGAIAIEPSDPGVLYVGTGEANPGGGSLAYGGNGLWKTANGGASWTALGLDSTGSVGRIAVDPVRPGRVFAATMGSLFSPGPGRGLYRSLDGGANWTRVLFVSDSTGCVDVAIDPSNSDRIFAATWERTRRPNTRTYGGPTSGIWRSLDGGNTWTRLGSGLPAPATNRGRIGIAIAPSDPSRIFAVIADASGVEAEIYRSLNGGNTWTLLPGSPVDGESGFAWWFGRIWVHPTNPLELWVAGIQLYRSDDGGQSWDVGAFVHADQHAMWFNAANPDQRWEGNDGGLYRSENGGADWTQVAALPITQVYALDVHPAQPLKVYAGAQDNGTVRTPAGDPEGWENIYFGDGFHVNVDPGNTGVIYAEYQYGGLGRSIDDGVVFAPAVTGISGGDRKNWSTPVVVDPTGPGYPQTRLYFGANRLYRSTNAAGSWTAISPDLTDGAGGSGGVVFGTLTTIAVAPSDSATIYAGTDDGNVWVTSNGGSSWQSIDLGLPKRWVTRVAVDPANAAVAYVSFSGLRWNEPLAHLFRTANRGVSWTDISGDLPDAPVNDVVIDPRNTAALYVATDVGVFATASAGASWAPLGAGMPEGVIVTDLEFLPGATPALYAGTYGRSVYRAELSSKVTGVTGGGPIAFELGAGPNPWRSRALVTFVLPSAGDARLDVVDVGGRKVATLLERRIGAGRHEVEWDGRDEAGRAVRPGIYFFRLEALGRSAVLRTSRLR